MTPVGDTGEVGGERNQGPSVAPRVSLSGLCIGPPHGGLIADETEGSPVWITVCLGRWPLVDGRWLVGTNGCRGYWQITHDRSPHSRRDNRPRRYATCNADLDHRQRTVNEIQIAHMQDSMFGRRPICKSALPLGIDIGIGVNRVDFPLGAGITILEPVLPLTLPTNTPCTLQSVPTSRRADLQIGRAVR